MKVSKKKAGEGKTSVTVTVPADEITDKVDEYSQQYCTAMGIHVEEGSWAHNDLIATAGIDATRKMIDNAIMGDAAEIAITMLELDIIAKPRYFNEESATEGKDFTFEMTLFDKPQLELSSYGPVTVNVPDFEVTEKDIEYLISRDAQQDVKKETDAERKTVKQGDEVEMAISTLQRGKVLDELTMDSRFYTVGEHLMPYDFDKEIVGMKVGETKEFDFMLPGMIQEDGSQADPELAHSTVTIKRIMKQILPTIDDAWVKENIDGFENLADYKESLRKEVTEEKTNAHRQQVANACANELGERIVGELPDDIFQACLEDLKKQFEAEAQQMGLTMDEYREKLHLNPQQFSMATMFQVEAQLRQTFALEALARHLEMEVEEEDYEKLYSLIAPGHEGLAQSQMERNGRTFAVTEAALHAKANDYLMTHATITSNPEVSEEDAQ